MDFLVEGIFVALWSRSLCGLCSPACAVSLCGISLSLCACSLVIVCPSVGFALFERCVFFLLCADNFSGWVCHSGGLCHWATSGVFGRGLPAIFVCVSLFAGLSRLWFVSVRCVCVCGGRA